MRNALWNFLTFVVILAALGVGVLFLQIFSNPYQVYNPFPPATQPATAFIPTSTLTPRLLPPTWTKEAGGDGYRNKTLRPSSTPFPTNQIYVFPTPSQTLTITLTPTITRTPTKSLTTTGSPRPKATYTRTETEISSVNKTATALSNVATRAALTAQSNNHLTATSAALTAAVSNLPPNPARATANPLDVPASPVSSDTWQNANAHVNFTWDVPPNAVRYYVYWGASPSGTSNDSIVNPPSYTPGAVSSGTYYLRVRTRFSGGLERADWSTIFILRYDNTPPGNPSVSANVPANTWVNSPDTLNFSLSGASDAHSGVKGYHTCFTTAADCSGGEDYNQGSSISAGVPADGTYKLYLRTEDLAGESLSAAGNFSSWITAFTYRFDNTPPGDAGAPSAVAPGSATPSFFWSAASDASSGVAGYDICWGGSDPANPCTCDLKTDTAPGPVYAVTSALSSPGTYFMCVRARDEAGNLNSNWVASAGYVYP